MVSFRGPNAFNFSPVLFFSLSLFFVRHILSMIRPVFVCGVPLSDLFSMGRPILSLIRLPLCPMPFPVALFGLTGGGRRLLRRQGSFSSGIGGWRWCWWGCQRALELIPPIRATVVKTLHKPITRQLGIMAGGPLFFHLRLSRCLRGPFLLLPLRQLLAKLRDPFVEHTIPLDFRKNLLHFQI